VRAWIEPARPPSLRFWLGRRPGLLTPVSAITSIEGPAVIEEFPNVLTLTSSISAKIIAAFGVIFLIVLALGGLSIDRRGMINDLTIATRDSR